MAVCRRTLIEFTYIMSLADALNEKPRFLRRRPSAVATAAAINLERRAAWFQAVPRAATRTSHFAALAA